MRTPKVGESQDKGSGLHYYLNRAPWQLGKVNSLLSETSAVEKNPSDMRKTMNASIAPDPAHPSTFQAAVTVNQKKICNCPKHEAIATTTSTQMNKLRTCEWFTMSRDSPRSLDCGLNVTAPVTLPWPGR